MFQGKAEGVLDRILGHVAFYCLDNDLPPLTCIVVNKRTGRPGADIPIDLAKLTSCESRCSGSTGIMCIRRQRRSWQRPIWRIKIQTETLPKRAVYGQNS